jgi:ParB-like chromosome segregation protein Spo0J
MRIVNQSYEMVPVSVLKTHPRNPRRGDVGAIAESVSENGFFGAVLVQSSSSCILAGNHRYLAAVQENATEVPVIWIDVDDDEALRILLADNRTADMAHYDEAALGALLSELTETSRGISGTGYSEDDVASLLAVFDEAEHAGGTGGSPTAPPLQVTIVIEASEHLVEMTKALATLCEAHPEWRARVQ